MKSFDHPLIWHIGKPASGYVVAVPAGFLYDVSVPWWLTWLADPDRPEYQRAACIHDYLLLQGWDRWTAGAAFFDGLKAAGVNTTSAVLMTLATIIGRWSEL